MFSKIRLQLHDLCSAIAFQPRPVPAPLGVQAGRGIAQEEGRGQDSVKDGGRHQTPEDGVGDGVKDFFARRICAKHQRH